ncbi:MAG: cytochrome c [Desulfobacterales bacterium]|nr:cytochrome c [Desulfobacterales bacterium]
MKKVLRWGVCGLFVMGVFGMAYAQFAKPEDAIGYRKGAMTLIGHHFSRIGAVVQGKAPFDKGAVAKDAELVATLSTLPWDAFMAPGAEKGQTHLKAEALKDKEGFRAAADATVAETARLSQVAATGDLDVIKTQFGAAGKSCKGCHEKYRTH